MFQTYSRSQSCQRQKETAPQLSETNTSIFLPHPNGQDKKSMQKQAIPNNVKEPQRTHFSSHQAKRNEKHSFLILLDI